MANNLTPIVYDAASKEHKPAAIGDHINPAYVAVDGSSANLLQNKSDNGLGVYAQDFVSPSSGNMLSASADGKLYVGIGDSKILSTQPGNYLRYGNDGGVFLDGNDVLSNGRANILHTSERDGRIELLESDLEELKLGRPSSDKNNLLVEGNDGRAMLQPKVIKHMIDDKVNPLVSDVADAKAKAEEALDATKHLDVTVVSKDRKNVITEGSDKGAYLSADDIVDVVKDAGITKVEVRDLINAGTDPLLSVQGDKLISGMSVQYNEVTGRLDVLGVHGNSIAHTTIPTAVALLKSVNLEDNPAGQPAGTYIHFVFELTDRTESHVYLNVNKLAQFYSAGEGIKIAEDGTVSVDRAFVEGVVEDTVDEELKEGGAIKDAIDDAVEEATKDINVVSKDSGNLIKPGTDNGAKLTNDDVAASVNNALYTGAVSVVSGNANNLITKGTDNGAVLTGEKIIETVGDSIKDIAVEAIEQAIKDGEVKIVSQDADNQLTAGSDGGAFLDKSVITDTVNEAIGDGTIPLVSTDEDNLLTAGSDGAAFLDKKDIPAAGPSADAGNALSEGSDGKLYYKPVTDYGELA